MTYHVAHELLGPRAAPILGGGGVDCIRDKGLLSSFRMGYGGGLSKEGRPLAAEDGGTQRAHRPSSPLPREEGWMATVLLCCASGASGCPLHTSGAAATVADSGAGQELVRIRQVSRVWLCTAIV
jgi:hypothetical protein